MTLVHLQPHPQVLKAAIVMKLIANWRGLGHGINAKIFPKVGSEKAQTMMSENRYIYLSIDFFQTIDHFNASSVNRKQCAGIIFGAPSITYLRYCLAVSPSVYIVFSSHLSVRLYLSSNDC